MNFQRAGYLQTSAMPREARYLFAPYKTCCTLHNPVLISLLIPASCCPLAGCAAGGGSVAGCGVVWRGLAAWAVGCYFRQPQYLISKKRKLRIVYMVRLPTAEWSLKALCDGWWRGLRCVDLGAAGKGEPPPRLHDTFSCDPARAVFQCDGCQLCLSAALTPCLCPSSSFQPWEQT